MKRIMITFFIGSSAVFGYSDDRQTQQFVPTGKSVTMTNYVGPQDTPTEHTDKNMLMKRQPFVEQARKTYPQARARFVAGLPKGARFYVTVDFKDGTIIENAYITVRTIEGNQIRGVVSTKLLRIKSHYSGEEVTFPESVVIDWTITSADGKEEGNFVGKFLDEYNAGRL